MLISGIIAIISGVFAFCAYRNFAEIQRLKEITKKERQYLQSQITSQRLYLTTMMATTAKIKCEFCGESVDACLCQNCAKTVTFCCNKCQKDNGFYTLD